MTPHDARLAPAALLSMVACTIAAPGAHWWQAAALTAVVAVAAAVVGLVGGGVGAVGPLGKGVGGLGGGGRIPRRPHGARALRRDWFTTRAARLVFAAAAIATIVLACAGLREERHLPAEVGGAIAAGERVQALGVVVSDPEPAGVDRYSLEPRWRATVALERACAVPCIGEPGSASARVAVVASGPMPRLGDGIAVTGTARRSSTTLVRATIWASEAAIVPARPSVWRAAGTARDRVRVLAAGVPEGVRPLVLGMVIGDTRGMDPALETAMRRTGLTHLTAVSGSHFAILWVCLMALLRRLTAMRVLRPRAAAARRVSAAIAAVSMALLALVVLPEPSVSRALTMALAGAAGWWWGRPARAVPALGAGIVVLLLIDPGLGGAVGLQLSAVAVLAIVLWAPVLTRRLERWLLRPLAQAVAVPLAAWLACAPLLVGLQGGIGLYTVPANLIAAIAAAHVTVLGVAGMVLGQVWLPGGALLMQAAGGFAWPVVWAARAFADAPGAWLAWPGGWLGAALAAAVSGCVLLASALPRLGSLARAAVLAVAIAATVVVPLTAPRIGPAADDWLLVACDVGQADAMLLRTGEHSAVMIDTGAADGTGAACVERYGVERIDLLVLTHPHADHDGAVAEVAAVAGVDSAWVSPAAVADGHTSAVEELRRLGVPVEVASQGMEWGSGGPSGSGGSDRAGGSGDGGGTREWSVRLRVLGPVGAAAGGQATGRSGAAGGYASDAAVNDASLAIFAQIGPVTLLTLGDLETAGQDAVAAALGGPAVVDVVKVAHHGSATQSQGLARLVTARLAVVSVGVNSYGHPSPLTLDLYAQSAGVVLTTRDCGDIAWTSAGAIASACGADVAG